MILVNQLIANVYNAVDVKIGTVTDLINVSIVKMVDGVGNFNLTFSGTDKDAMALLVADNRVRIYAQQSSGLRLIGGGIINSVKIQETGGSTSLVASGPDFLQDLVVKSVLLNRAYNNLPVSDIADDLITLVPGWTAVTEEGLGNQTARFDGASVFKSILRLAEELGAHLRSWQDNIVEVGFFGQDTGLRVINLKGVPTETEDNKDILILDSISQENSSDQVIDWVMPIGAGTGSTALTLKKSTRTSPYPIQSMVGPDGATLYYISSAGSPSSAKQRVITFKQIGPIANSDSAKILAANALYDAAVAWLNQNNQQQITYDISCKNAEQVPNPGDKIRLTYKGKVRDRHGRLFSRIDVDDYFWVMRVEEKFTAAGSSVSMTITNIDKVKRDVTDVVVGALESIQAAQVSVQTFPFGFQDSSERVIQGAASPSDAQYKPALFSLLIPNIFTDVISVQLRVLTRPLYSMTDVGAIIVPSVPYATANDYTYAVYPAPNYPSDITLTIDGVDVTSALGGPWNPGGGNSPVDVNLDITQYIINAPGGLYQNHQLIFAAGYKTGETRVSTAHPSRIANSSNGIVEAKILFLGTARAVIPSP